MDGRHYFRKGARVKPLQAKHIDTRLFLALVEYKERNEGHWTLLWDITEAFGVPWSVARGKLARMKDARLVDGCDCGCRGDIELLPRGAELLGYGQSSVRRYNRT